MIDFSPVDAPADEDLPRDTIPEVADIEYPCEKCGREAGPYKGRGRKPKVCADCKPKRQSTSGAVRVTGTNATLATQATAVLSQMNALMAMGLSALSMFRTAGAIAAHDETFKQQAYDALITDPELCKFLLRGGLKSGKAMLVLAYGSMGMAVAPTAVMEYREVMAERAARKGVDE